MLLSRSSKTRRGRCQLHVGKRPLSSVTAGDIEDFKSLGRAVHKVREVTVRHDLHALSLLFQYGRKHNWCKANVVDEVEIPSDSDTCARNLPGMIRANRGKQGSGLELAGVRESAAIY